jgi:peptide/nickel transport system substrate-binding protein
VRERPGWRPGAQGASQFTSAALKLQRQAMIDVPYVPLGQVLTATAFRTSISGVLNGIVTFWNVQKA